MTGKKTNPHEQSYESARAGASYAFLLRGTVTSAPSGQTDGQHEVSVQEAAIPADAKLPVISQVHGDKYIPPEGAPVVASPIEKNKYGVIGAVVPGAEMPSLEPGERIISHPLSKAHVRFNKDGSLDIVGDTQITINGGTQGIITDVAAGNTNSNGGITSLDITRDSSVKI